jgi:serine/threonine protein kinase
VPPNVPIHTIQRSDLEALVEMSKGNYGRVYKGRCQHLDVAIKEMIGIKKNNVEQKMGEFLGEVNILQRLHHPNIITFLGVCIDGDAVQEWYIVLEWAERASLQKLLEKEKNLPMEFKFKICIDIARGMGWLHHRPKPIIHFDLKPANILVMSDYTCKIADFGLSIISEMKSSSANRGTMLYMPPETLRRKWYYKAGMNKEAEEVPLVPPELLPKIDVYSYGLIMWEICSQTEVFLEYNEIEEFCSAICDKDARPKITDAIPVHMADIMTKCWAKVSNQRPDFRELVPQLETARIKVFLEHRGEVAFWQSYFPTKPRVPFSDFVKALWRHTAKANKKPGSSEKTCGFESSLLKLMAEDSKAEVSLESYGRLIGWFGPLNERGYFEDFCNIMQMESTWFFSKY